MKYEVVETFFNVKRNGDHKPVKVGTLLSAREYSALTPAKQAKCQPVEKAGRWTEEQHYCLIELYFENADVENGNITEVVKLFRELHPERSLGSVNARAWSILGLDTHCPKVGLGTYSQDLVNLLHEVDPVRFPEVSIEGGVAGKLDNLLAQIRA